VSLATQTAARPAGEYRVTRSRRNVAWTGAGALIVVIVLAVLPYFVYSGTTSVLVQAFIVLILASMWNLLAGYAGLVSVGQQAFVGLGAYFVLIPATHGLSPFASLPIATVGAGVAAFPLWWLVSRLRSGYFAIATWVLAATVMLIIEKFSSIGGGTGMPLPGLGGLGPTLLAAHLGMSKRSLQRLFEGETLSVSQLIQAKRVDQVLLRLRDPRYSGTSLDELAVLTGFGSALALRRAVQSVTGKTPSVVRAEGMATHHTPQHQAR
jgi:ABC-type branched-subunit amino acid transport system permease subunit